MGYFDWHAQPGYYRDVTRHFPLTATLLDIGCGIGWLADHFGDYTGIDGAPLSRRVIRRRSHEGRSRARRGSRGRRG
jgi:SAM-dependent methyltransferase